MPVRNTRGRRGYAAYCWYTFFIRQRSASIIGSRPRDYYLRITRSYNTIIERTILYGGIFCSEIFVCWRISSKTNRIRRNPRITRREATRRPSSRQSFERHTRTHRESPVRFPFFQTISGRERLVVNEWRQRGIFDASTIALRARVHTNPPSFFFREGKNTTFFSLLLN